MSVSFGLGTTIDGTPGMLIVWWPSKFFLCNFVFPEPTRHFVFWARILYTKYAVVRYFVVKALKSWLLKIIIENFVGHGLQKSGDNF